jgi:hypothetical protein
MLSHAIMDVGSAGSRQGDDASGGLVSSSCLRFAASTTFQDNGKALQFHKARFLSNLSAMTVLI